MSLTNVWVRTWADGLVRADQIVGIDAHPTPAIAGKPSRWLVDAVLTGPAGSGTQEQWGVTMLHRTLIQTGTEPRDAPLALARLLSQLDLVSAAGTITVDVDPVRPPGRRTPVPDEGSGQARRHDDPDPERAAEESRSGHVRFRFVPFAEPAPGHHTDREYL